MNPRLQIFFSALLLVGCLNGCVSESNFRLSDESRLPRWFNLPEGKKREDVTVTLYYYSMPSGGRAKLILKDRDGWFPIDRVEGKLRELEPMQLESASGNDDPEYEILSAEGITDIIEHREKNDIFYMVDDPAVWSELGVDKAGSE